MVQSFTSCERWFVLMAEICTRQKEIFSARHTHNRVTFETQKQRQTIGERRNGARFDTVISILRPWCIWEMADVSIYQPTDNTQGKLPHNNDKHRVNTESLPSAVNTLTASWDMKWLHLRYDQKKKEKENSSSLQPLALISLNVSPQPQQEALHASSAECN